MAEPIIINVALDKGDIDKAATQVRQKFASALDGVRQDAARAAQTVGKLFDGTARPTAANLALLQQRFDQLNASQKKTVQTTTATATAFGVLAGAATVASAAIGGLLNVYFKLAQGAANTAKEVFDLADKTGVSVKNIDLFRRAALEAGKGLDVVQRSMDQFTSRLERASNTSGILSKTFRELGVDPKKGIEDANKALEQTIIALNRIENPAIRAAKAQEVFGLRNEAIIPILTRLGESLEAYGARVGDVGAITEEQAKAGKSFDVSLNILNATIGALGQTIGNAMIPAVQASIDLIQTLVKGVVLLLNSFGLATDKATPLTNQIDLLNAALRATPAWVNVVVTALAEGATAFLQFKNFVGQAAAAAAAFFSGNFAAAAALAGVAGNTASGIGAGFGQATQKAFDDALKQTGTQFGKLRQERARLANLGKGGLDIVGDEANAKTKAARDAQLALEQKFQDNQIKIAQDARKRALEVLEDSYDLGLISAKEYYDNRLQITVSGLDAELDAMKAQQANIETALKSEKLSTAERIKLNQKLNDVFTDQILKTNEIVAAQEKILVEQKKAFASSARVDLDLQLPDPQAIFRTPIQQEAFEKMVELQRKSSEFRVLDNQLALEEQRIQNAVNVGLLNEAEGRERLTAIQAQFRDRLIESLEADRERQRILGDKEAVARLDLEIERLQTLGVQLNNAGRFMRGFGSEVDTVGDAFERFGQNVSNSFRNVKTLFDGLKNAVKQFFADLVGNSLQQLVRGTLGGLFNQKGLAIAGSPVNFSTPNFNPNAGGAASGFPGLLGSIFSGGSGIAIPRSTSGVGIPITIGGTGTFGIPGIGAAIPGIGQQSGLGGILGKLFGGLTPGGRIGLGPALLGAGLGAGLGGQSILGNILGGIGGSAVGLGLAFGSSVLGAGGTFGAAALAALGPAALIGAPLLIGALLLGKAKQRRADESASGDFLQQAIDAINNLKLDVQADRIQGTEARPIFENQILATFIAQINTLKTKSVRESRLTNQVRDLRNLFESSVVPAITAQLLRKTNASQLIPEFAFGGMVPGFDRGYDSVLSYLRPGEMVLTVNHQNAIKGLAGGDVFNRVGVPDAPMSSVGGFPGYAYGGVAPRPISAGNGGGNGVFLIELYYGMSQSSAEDLLEVAINGERGQNAIGRVTVINERNERRLKK